MTTAQLPLPQAVAPAAITGEPRLRVAVVTPELHRTGGTERATAELLESLSREHDICLYSIQWNGSNRSPICFHPVPVVSGPGVLRHLNFFLAASLAVWRGEQRHGAYDCIYSPGANCAQVNVSTAWFCQARQRDLLRSGRFQPPPAGFNDRLRRFHRTLSANWYALLEGWFYASRRLEKVICPAYVVRRDLMDCYRVSPDRLVVAHSGVDTSTFNRERRLELRDASRRELGIAPGDFCFLFVGTDWVRKCLVTVLDALACVPGALLYAVGPYDPEPYRRYAKRAGVAGRVFFPPRRADVISYYAAADAVVAPSFYEPFGMVPLEATACGVPAIITRQMGVAEVLDENSAILLDDPADSAALAPAMRRLMDDPDLRQRLALQGELRAGLSSWDSINQASLDAIRVTASQRRAAARRRVGA
ncbi:MAG TPA: glycosyltransferase family 4 protein [Candidatus Acidoferrales bacterium]|nr:glycosyltransferase family 4 protein [Candidatus Acidoferrales bacterium]